MPKAGDDQVQWIVRGAIRSLSSATNRPVVLSSTIKLGALGEGMTTCELSTPLDVHT